MNGVWISFNKNENTLLKFKIYLRLFLNFFSLFNIKVLKKASLYDNHKFFGKDKDVLELRIYFKKV